MEKNLFLIKFKYLIIGIYKVLCNYKYNEKGRRIGFKISWTVNALQQKTEPYINRDCKLYSCTVVILTLKIKFCGEKI